MTELFLVAVLTALGLAYAGMAGLSLAMKRHFSQVWHSTPAPLWLQRSLRSAGWLLLALALIPCINYWGITVGLVVWPGFISAAALLLAGLLSYLPRMAAAVALLALIASLTILLNNFWQL